MSWPPYEKAGNVWLANPDGSGQRQLTTAGGYGRPSLSADEENSFLDWDLPVYTASFLMRSF